MVMKDRLKQVRQKLGKSQRAMAALIGMSYKGWQQYESGVSIPGGAVLESLARLGFNVNWILTGEGLMGGLGPSGTEDDKAPYRGEDRDHGSEGILEARVEYHTPQPAPRQGTATIVAEEDSQAVHSAVSAVMESKHKGVKLALTQNALMFEEMVRMATEIDALRDENTGLRRQVAVLERDMQIIKDRILGVREADFKTQPEPVDEAKSGGENGTL